jgi:cobalt/nickel transport protein
MLTRQNILLLIVALIISLAPFAFASDFTGTDDKAVGLIGQLRPDYKPWFSAFFEPTEETEHVLFGAQFALGAGFIGYFVYRQGRKAR